MPVAVMVFVFFLLSLGAQILLVRYYPTVEVKTIEHELMI